MLNQLFITDPKLQRFCKQHSGKSITLNYHSFKSQLYIHQSGFTSCKINNADSQITMNFEALLSYLNIKHPDAKVSITGNAALGQSFSQVLLQSSIHSKSLLYHHLPPTTAMLVTEISKYHKKLSSRVLSILKSQLHHYLIYEAGLCADKHACESQYQSILNLKHMLERLKST